MAAALNSPHDVSGAAHLPRAVAARSGVSYVGGAGHAITAVRVEGFGPSVEARCKALRDLLAGFGPVEELHSMNSAKLWREIRDVAPLLPDGSPNHWRLSVPPAAGAAVMAALVFGNGIETETYFYDWGGGQIWLTIPPAEPAETAGAIRAAVTPTGGHATLMRASEETRERVSESDSEAPALAAVAQRLKDAFDPKGLFNAKRLA
jgi:glycolate oxidase FAD binding subunit